MTTRTSAQALNDASRPRSASLPVIGFGDGMYRRLESVIRGLLSARDRTGYRV